MPHHSSDNSNNRNGAKDEVWIVESDLKCRSTGSHPIAEKDFSKFFQNSQLGVKSAHLKCLFNLELKISTFCKNKILLIILQTAAPTT